MNTVDEKRLTRLQLLKRNIRKYSTIRDYLLLCLQNVNTNLNRFTEEIREEELKNAKNIKSN